MGFGTLRVINEDRVAPGQGFGTHPPSRHGDHQLRAGGRAGAQGQHGHGFRDPARRRAAHERGHRRVPQRVQSVGERSPCTSCRSGSSPNQYGIAPGYEQKNFTREEKKGRLRLIASPDGAEGSVKIHQDARVYAGVLEGDDAVTYALAAGSPGLCARGARVSAVERHRADRWRRGQDQRARRNCACRVGRARKCCCSIW